MSKIYFIQKERVFVLLVSIYFIFNLGGYFLMFLSGKRVNFLSASVICDEKRQYLNDTNLTHHINPKFVKFQISPKKLCQSNDDIKVFVYIFNKVTSIKKRKAIRKTWANKMLFPKIKVAFILGLSKDERINQLVKFEADKYDDIIQGTFIDSLRNLSYKSITAWKWSKDYCKKANYILKVDDDTVVNTFALLNFVDYLLTYHKFLSNTYFCHVLKKRPVERYFFNKHYITCEEYSKKYFNDYCHGAANLFTSDTVSRLYNATHHVNSFWVDDSYVGMVTHWLKIDLFQIENRMLTTKEIENKKDKFFLFIRNSILAKDIYKNWDLILDKHTVKYNDSEYNWKKII